MPTSETARQIAETDEQIAHVEARIFQQQKRIENLLAKGADVAELEAEIVTLTQALADLKARKAQLAGG